MSKAMTNWQRLPNSRMDRQHRPRAYLAAKARTDAHALKIQTVTRLFEAGPREERRAEK